MTYLKRTEECSTTRS